MVDVGNDGKVTDVFHGADKKQRHPEKGAKGGLGCLEVPRVAHEQLVGAQTNFAPILAEKPGT